jgi:hypothetical protein
VTTWADLDTWGAWSSWPLTVDTGATWGDWNLWGDLETWFDPTGTYTGPTVADLSPVDLAAPTIRPLERITASMLPVASVKSSMRALTLGDTASVGPASVGASALTLAPESLAPTSRVVGITSVSPTVSGFTLLLTPADLPTVGIPVFAGAGTPDHPGPYLWIVDADTIYYEDGT